MKGDYCLCYFSIEFPYFSPTLGENVPLQSEKAISYFVFFSTIHSNLFKFVVYL